MLSLRLIWVNTFRKRTKIGNQYILLIRYWCDVFCECYGIMIRIIITYLLLLQNDGKRNKIKMTKKIFNVFILKIWIILKKTTFVFNWRHFRELHSNKIINYHRLKIYFNVKLIKEAFFYLNYFYELNRKVGSKYKI